MKHIIITRYDYPDNYKHKEERKRLFETYTKPSIEAQINKDFKWIIIGQTHNWKECRNEIEKSKDWVVTTRLDNDDMLLPNFTEEISKLKPEEKVIDFSGYRYDERTGKFYEDTKYQGTFTSPFVSLIERSENFKGVYRDQHQRLHKYYPIERINKRLWVQIIHNTNILMNQRHIESQGKLIDKPSWFKQ